MRKAQLIVTIALMGIFLITGCRTSSSSSPSYSMRATIGTASMDGTICTAAVAGTALGIGGVTVTGGTGGPPEINLTIANWGGSAGVFSIGTVSSGSFAEYVVSASSTLVSQSGSITISSVSTTTITGTFNFTCTDGTVISAGTFSAKRY